MFRYVPQSHINILRHMRKRPSRSSCQDICKPCRLSYYSFVEEDAQYLHRSRESMLLAQTQTPKIQYPPKLDLRSPQWLGGRKGCVTTLLARLSNTFNSDQLKGELAMKLVHRANTIFRPLAPYYCNLYFAASRIQWQPKPYARNRQETTLPQIAIHPDGKRP